MKQTKHTVNHKKPTSRSGNHQSGFTIIELLIVVVVIAVLAAILIVSYNGITSRAVETTMKSDLQNAASSLELYSAQNNGYPTSAGLVNNGSGLLMSGDNSASYSLDGDTYCVTVTNPRVTQPYYLSSSSGQVKSGSCNDAGNVWIARSVPSENWFRIAYGNGRFIAVGGGNVTAGSLAPPVGIASADGAQWSGSFPLGSLAAQSPYIAYGGGARFAARMSVGYTGSVATTDNGQTWQNDQSIPGGGSYLGSALAYGNGTYVATVAPPPETYSRVYTSVDGITWTSRGTTIPWTSWSSVTYGNGLFVAVASSGTTRVMTSPDGVTWTARSGAATTANAWISVTYGNGRFVAVANSGTNRAMTSTDGINWTLSNATDQSAWTSVTYGNGKFVAVANSGTNRVMTSTNGIDWTGRSAAEANAWVSVTYGEGCFVALSSDGANRVMTSCW